MSADFPALAPTSRTWSVGAPPVASFVSMTGRETRVLLGDAAVGTQLSLQFSNVAEASALAIANHFSQVRGVMETFTVPSSVFAGMTNASSVKPLNTSWRYASAPTIDWLMPGFASVSVDLVAVID